MRAWYSPSWNGDFRLEARDDGGCDLIVWKPTLAEKAILEDFLKSAKEKTWIAKDAKAEGWGRTKRLALTASVAEAGEELVRYAKPEKRTVTAMKFSSGKVEVSEGATLASLVEKAKPDKDAKAVTVKRATPCCPRCIPGSIGPASEVLQAFMTPAQHSDWSRHRMLEVEGGESGHRYLLAHRHTTEAQRWGRICFDADDVGVMHFHDWSVPPEEEVLGAMLVLEHREDWLRNEATCFAGTLKGNRFAHVFKNPHGDIMEGTIDSALMHQLGQVAMLIPFHADGFKGILPELIPELDLAALLSEVL